MSHAQPRLTLSVDQAADEDFEFRPSLLFAEKWEK
jgi:hypothetical protein